MVSPHITKYFNLGHLRYRFGYAFGRHHALMVNQPDHCATSDEHGLKAEVEDTTVAVWSGRAEQRREPRTFITLAIFRQRFDGEDFHESSRLTIAEARELGQWLTKRANENRQPLRYRLWDRIRGHEYIPPNIPTHRRNERGEFVPIEPRL